MITIILEWIYLFAAAYCLGYGFARLVKKLFQYTMKRMDALLVTGLILLTVYAQTFSIFYKVGVAANVILVVVMVLLIAIFHKQMIQDMKEQWKNCSIVRKVVLLALFLLWAFYTSRGYMVYDTGLYHGQSIRWIEEYGVVKGLGNIHERFAYNSSLFAMYALFSLKFLTGGFPLHTINGFIAFTLSMSVLDIAKVWKRKSMRLSDFASAAAIYYLTTICDEVIAPSSDYAVMCVIFYIVISWLRQLENEEEKSIVPYALLCVAGVYALTLKLTAGLILLLVLKPAIYLIRNKKWKDIAIYLTLGILVAAPWLARSVIISGWLLYPFEALDLFAVDWKMDATMIPVDAAQIKTWGRALYDIALVNVPITGWFPNWFRTTLLSTEKLLILADIGCVVLYIIAVIIQLVRRKKAPIGNWDILLVIGTMMCSYLYWQTSAPLMRYGYAYVLLFAALMLGWIVIKLGWSRIVFFAILLFGLYKSTWLVRYTLGCAALPNYIWQEDYEVFELETFESDGVTFYKPVYTDRTGYYSFPAVPIEVEIELRGEGMADGFRRKSD